MTAEELALNIKAFCKYNQALSEQVDKLLNVSLHK